MYGLVGYNIGYTFSEDIHKRLGYPYTIHDVDEKAFKEFMLKKEFKGINVTIPYKTSVMEYLDHIDPLAKKLNAVNTVVNKDGKLYGYNTDYAGLMYSLEKNNVSLKDKKVLILGTGSTSGTTKNLAEACEAQRVVSIGRSTKISYDDLSDVSDFEVIFNTTPVGVFPNIYTGVIDLKQFVNLEVVVDMTYNPLKTKLVYDATELGVKAFGGLLMLVAQAVYSSQYFFDKELDLKVIDDVYRDLLFEKQNIVLIGMPTAGKTTVGKRLAQDLKKDFKDVDQIIVETENKTIKDIFNQDGEVFFRMKESTLIKQLSALHNTVIATGGGSVLDKTNIDYLSLNGVIIYIDRALDLLEVSDERPLSSSSNTLKNLYDDRKHLYKKYSDIKVLNNDNIEDTVSDIIKVLK